MRRLALVTWLIVAAGCAPVPPVVSVPTTPLHPEFVFPDVPAGTPATTADRLQRGWRLLQMNDFPAAERELAPLLRANRAFRPAQVAQGYLDLARRRPAEALEQFDAATAGAPYASALVGRGLTLLELARNDEALASFEAALAVNPGLPNLAGRVEVLRIQQIQDRVGRAERAAADGRWDEASAAYRAAITASPESAFLYLDLARTERSAGRADSALENAQRATTLDAEDPAAHVVVAELLTERRDFDGAIAAYGRASARGGSSAIDAAVARVRDMARDAALPSDYHAISGKDAITRGDLAAMLGVQLEGLLASVPQRQLVVTDIRGHWAQSWIEAAARAGAIEVFSNYTFQPSAPLRRGDLADIVSRVLSLIAPNASTMREWDDAPVSASDVPAGHLAYPAVRRAVASGVMRLDNGAFRLLQPVTGTEALEVIARLASQEAAHR